ncbi:MAG: GNAT family N-acetyltransferase [Mycobacterium leprae]
MLDPHQIGFRKLTMADLPLIHRWLNETPTVKDFYGHGEETPYAAVVAKYEPRVKGEDPTTSYIITYGETPIGYIQTYLWRSYPDYAQYLELQEEAASLDVFIGDEEYLHKGLGSHMLRAFVDQIIFADPRIASCVITPEARNPSALRAYEKAGFQRVREIDHPDEPGPVCLMRIGREALPA